MWPGSTGHYRNAKERSRSLAFPGAEYCFMFGMAKPINHDNTTIQVSEVELKLGNQGSAADSWEGLPHGRRMGEGNGALVESQPH